MGKVGSALVGLGAALALVGCGGSDDGRTSDRLGEAGWTLTFVTPVHGSNVASRTDVEVAISGDAAALGESADFDLGFFIDGQLVTQSRDPRATLTLPIGTHTLGVEGVDRSGQVLENVIGDEISVDINLAPARELPADFPRVNPIEGTPSTRGNAGRQPRPIDPRTPGVDPGTVPPVPSL